MPSTPFQRPTSGPRTPRAIRRRRSTSRTGNAACRGCEVPHRPHPSRHRRASLLIAFFGSDPFVREPPKDIDATPLLRHLGSILGIDDPPVCQEALVLRRYRHLRFVWCPAGISVAVEGIRAVLATRRVVHDRTVDPDDLPPE